MSVNDGQFASAMPYALWSRLASIKNWFQISCPALEPMWFIKKQLVREKFGLLRPIHRAGTGYQYTCLAQKMRQDHGRYHKH
jgi:hypothetical protein